MNKQWITVTIKARGDYYHTNRRAESRGIKVWAQDNKDAEKTANEIIDLRLWEIVGIGPTRVKAGETEVSEHMFWHSTDGNKP